MYWWHAIQLLSLAVGIASEANAADTNVYRDADTGFIFAQYAAPYDLNGGKVFFRIASPSPPPTNQAYDVVVQIAAPLSSSGWSGLAWGGSMINDPLTVVWPNGNSVQLSSRYATQHVAPNLYSGATYQVFKTGTRVNSTHWQITAKCTGCTSFGSTILNPKGIHRLAFAWSASRPNNPSSSSSSLQAHDIYNYWDHDFSMGANTGFTSLVAKNLDATTGSSSGRT